MFVLAFCVFDKEHYAEHVTTAVQQLKFKYFGHDALVLHEREIRKAKPPFGMLRSAEVRSEFMTDVSQLVANAEFEVIAAVIRKDRYAERYGTKENVYHVAMRFALERLGMHVGGNTQTLHIVCESRGKREDADLELAFRRICKTNRLGVDLPFELIFAKKERAHAGMELADLIARPIGRHVLNPSQSNRAWDEIEKKLRRSPRGNYDGWGLKVFP